MFGSEGLGLDQRFGSKGLGQRVWVRGSVFGSEGLDRTGITGVECECHGVTWVRCLSVKGGHNSQGLYASAKGGHRGCVRVSSGSHGVVYESQEGS